MNEDGQISVDPFSTTGKASQCARAIGEETRHLYTWVAHFGFYTLIQP